MSNTLSMNGAQPQKPTRFAPIYTGRWSSGLWTNRSPLRDANTTRLTEKYYGPAGDALIDGSNVEITNRLSLARRPGNSPLDANTYNNVNGLYDFRVFNATEEQIKVMIDQADALYALASGTKTKLWTKPSGAGQSHMQSVGNTLYWGDGVSDKKWLQSLVTWSPGAQWNTASTPFFSTFLIDPNGNIQQLVSTNIPVTHVQVQSNELTVTSSESLSGVISAGMALEFPGGMTATFLNFQTITVTAVSANTLTANFVTDDYSDDETGSFMTETSGGVNPTSGTAPLVWSTVTPSATNNYQGGVTQDGMVRWVNRGSPVQNWGMRPPTTSPSLSVGTSSVAWQANTCYSGPGVVIDSNGNLQQVTQNGVSGSAQPTWATTLHGVTVEGTTKWMLIQTAASLVWQANTPYVPPNTITLTSVAAASGTSTVYTGSITNGASNAYAGYVFVVSGFAHSSNNGVFVCTASSNTTLTLTTAGGHAEAGNATARSNPSYVVGNAYGTNCLYYPASTGQVALEGSVSGYIYPLDPSLAGTFALTYPTSLGTAAASTTTQNSLSIYGTPNVGSGPLYWDIINGAGQSGGQNTPFPSFTQNFQLIVLAALRIPAAGQYTFTLEHHDGMFWGIGNGATFVSGSSTNNAGQTVTAAQGYPIMGGTNGTTGLQDGQLFTDTVTVNFPSAGVYPIEIDYAYWYHNGLEMRVLCNSLPIPNGLSQSGTNAPIWPEWDTNYAPQYPSITEENGIIEWMNAGPVVDFTWAAGTGYTLPATRVIDLNGNYEYPYRTGITGVTAPLFGTGTNTLTYDNPNLLWVNQGAATLADAGSRTLSAFGGGYKYCIALVNTLDDTVSNASPLSTTTGNFVGADGVVFTPGEGLDLGQIDPQADYVAIFRTTDGQSTPFLIPGENTTYTVPLATYLTDGYTDTTPDTELDNLIEAPLAGESTAPAPGAQGLTYHLNRLWYFIGNTVYWTAGPDAPCGNGVNGVPPSNYDTFPSLVKRLVPTTSGVMVFTVSDVYLIQGAGTASNPIQSGIPLMKGIGLSSYNALGVNGSIIGFFTTDSQFLILDPSTGVSNAGFPIGDKLRSWTPANVYVSWHVNGEDQGWYLADGSTGWYRLMTTPAPETGYTWSPFATIAGGVRAVQSLEVSPGTHRLLLGPTGSGSLLQRDLGVWQDNGVPYPASAVVGSAVLAQPGQIATVAFITTDSVNLGTPLTLGLLMDEALPYYTGEFDTLTTWVNDPPGLPPSRSILGQRFYLSQAYETQAAACRHLQVQITWPPEAQANELLTMTMFGGFFQES